MITGVSGSGKSTLAFDILFAEGQRRYLESLNAYARQFVQAASRPDVDAIFGIPPTVAIEQRTSRGGRKSTVGDAHRDLSLPAPALREARHAVLPGLRRADRAAERGRDRRAHPERVPRRDASALLAPLVMNRKGFYTDLAKWAAGKGYYAPARRRRVRCRRARGRASTASGSTPSSCRSARSSVVPENEKRAARSARAGARDRQGRGARAAGGGKTHRRSYLDQARLPLVRPQLPRARPAPLLVQLEARLVRRAATAPGSQIDEVEWDDERARTGAEDHVLDSWIEWLEVDEACPAVRRAAPQPRSARGALARAQSIAAYRALPVEAARRSSSPKLGLAGREGEIARDILAELQRAPRLPRAGRPRLPRARPLGADALRRRGAAHPPRGAARLQPARRLLHPRRADHRPAPARQPHPARHAREARGEGQHAGRGRARRGHDPPRAPRASTSGRAPASSAAR